MWRKGNPLTLLVGMQAGTASLENSMEVPQDIKNRATIGPATALLGIYPKDTDVLKRRGMCTPKFTAAMSTMAKLWKELRCPLKDEWIMKIWYIHTHTHTHTHEYYTAFRK